MFERRFKKRKVLFWNTIIYSVCTCQQIPLKRDLLISKCLQLGLDPPVTGISELHDQTLSVALIVEDCPLQVTEYKYLTIKALHCAAGFKCSVHCLQNAVLELVICCPTNFQNWKWTLTASRTSYYNHHILFTHNMLNWHYSTWNLVFCSFDKLPGTVVLLNEFFPWISH